MAQKTRQHIIPQVYLRAFCDPRPPAAHPAPKPFMPALWVHSPSLEGTPRRVAPKNVAHAHRAYTLKQDNPDRPWIEESLSRLEDMYASAMARVGSSDPLTIEDRGLLSLFIGALHARTERMMADTQAFFEKITGFSRAYMSDKEDKSIEPWGELADAGKRQIEPFSQAFAKVVGPHMLLLENRTPMPFITSDMPVTHAVLHADELINGLGIPEDWLYVDIPRSAREFFVFCPLTPWLGYLSSRFLPPRLDVQRAVTEYVPMVFALNELTRDHADRALYASSPTPYGSLLTVAKEHERRQMEVAEERKYGLEVYSENERYWLPTTWVYHGNGDHPLTGRIEFRTDDMETLRRMVQELDLVEITIVRDGQYSGGGREAWFVQVALEPGATSVIENGPVGRPL